jgi:hypothetical protein
MRVLLVIHGYPMRFNAGSEVYTQTLSRGLADRHEVRVFTRQEDPSRPPYSLVDDVDDGDPRVALRVINNAASRDRYRHDEIDDAFETLLDEFHPDIVHVGHLSHLSTSLVRRAAQHGIPLVYTLHDFWLMCPRGQFIQRTAGTSEEPFSVCNGQEDRKCALRCYSLYFSGAAELHEAEAAAWTTWVRERMSHVRDVAADVGRFIAPSRYLLSRYRDEFGIPPRSSTSWTTGSITSGSPIGNGNASRSSSLATSARMHRRRAFITCLMHSGDCLAAPCFASGDARATRTLPRCAASRSRCRSARADGSSGWVSTETRT